jgi:protease-4
MAIVFAAALFQTWWGKKGLREPHVAVVELSGLIIGASSILRDLDDLRENALVKAVVMRINSPGGLVGPSQEIFEALKRVDEKIPVVISMGSLAASGGYYAALGGRKIIANPGTLTASIGVIMELVNTRRLYEWAKIDRYTLKAGKFKDTGSPLREMTKEDRALLEGLLQNVHAQFITAVKQRRKIDGERLGTATDGRVLSGEQALKLGLVDGLGGLEVALHEARSLAGLSKDAPVSYPGSKRGFLRRLVLGDDEPENRNALEDFLSSAASYIKLVTASSGMRLWYVAPGY